MLTQGQALNKYRKLLSSFQDDAQRLVATSIRLRRGFNQRNRVLSSLGRMISSTNESLMALEEVIGVSSLESTRVYHLNEVYLKAYSLLNDTAAQRSAVMTPQRARQIAEQVDSIFTVRYRDDSRHTVADYLDAVIDDELTREATARLVQRAFTSEMFFAYVSTNETARTCYICRFWMGKVGTVGVDVPGYVRLDHIIPLHSRCIHYIILVGSEAELINMAQPDAWMLDAERSEYYARFSETEDGADILRQQRQEYRSSPGNRENRLREIRSVLLR
jgi:hypothetical protein